MRELSYLSREYFEAEITAVAPDGTAVPPADLPVKFAFVPAGAAADDADWQDAANLRGDVFGVLIGPAALVLDRGDYDVWRRITDDPEEPTEPFGKLRIY